ncbi:hypothetical protein GQ457_04G003650 [Hibiscus cannabinus]
MRKIASLNRRDGVRRTIVAAIHQPSSEVFHLFHNLFLLSAGQTVYFGALPAANEFFAVNGFPCPTLQNPSDHFLKSINKDFDKDIEEGFANAIPAEEVINILVNSYKSSDIFQHAQTEIAQSCKQVRNLPPKRHFLFEMVTLIHVEFYGFQYSRRVEQEKRHASFFTQCHVLTRRSFINMYRDPGYYRLRLAIYAALSLALAVMFNHLGLKYGSIQVIDFKISNSRKRCTDFVRSFNSDLHDHRWIPSFMEEMKVFERERLNGHYGVAAFVLANTISGLPFLTAISVISGTICYYIPGLHKDMNISSSLYPLYLPA